jgi:hypothetical protein
MLRPMIIRRSLAAVLVSVLLAACGGSSHGTSASSTTSTARNPSAGTASTASSSTASASSSANSVSGSITGTSAVTTTAKARRPPEVPGGKAKRGRGAKTTSSSDVSIPAAFVIGSGGKLSPPSVAVPPKVPVALTVENQDGTSHTLVLAAPQRRTLHARAHGSARTVVTGLANGVYRILMDGSAQGQLVIGAQGGP